jgi:hypothetical protein
MDNQCGPFLLTDGGFIENKYPGSPVSFWLDVENGLNKSLSFHVVIAVPFNLDYTKDTSVCVSGSAAGMSFSECYELATHAGNLTVSWEKALPPMYTKGRAVLNLWCHESANCPNFVYAIQTDVGTFVIFCFVFCVSFSVPSN